VIYVGAGLVIAALVTGCANLPPVQDRGLLDTFPFWFNVVAVSDA
jgi:hypothetical protein